MDRDIIWNKAYDIVRYSHFILNDKNISNKDKWEFVKKIWKFDKKRIFKFFGGIL